MLDISLLILVCILAAFILLLFILRVRKNVLEYKARYAQCMADIEESFLDVIKATRIIMDGEDPKRTEAVIVESIVKNVIVPRIFAMHDVICTRESSTKWILKTIWDIELKYHL